METEEQIHASKPDDVEFSDSPRFPSETGCLRDIDSNSDKRGATSHVLQNIYTILCIIILFVNYFLAQYDKFILSYFQTAFSKDLDLTSTQYGVLSGYATGIVYALLALPIAYLADYFPSARVWVLTIAALWWSLCVVFQGLTEVFWQVLLARIGMGIGQAAVEPLSVSLVSDLVGGWGNVFVGESVFYVGVYVGEAVSGQIATAFTSTGTSWRVAMKAIGITGLVVAVVLRIVLRDPGRRQSLVQGSGDDEGQRHRRKVIYDRTHTERLAVARAQLRETVAHLVRMRSFWLLVVSASFRQLAGNVFGYYMPSYLSSTYPSQPELLSRYGIIVGAVGSFSVLAGGAVTSALWQKTKLTPLYMTGIGGMISSIFVLLMIFSRQVAGGDQEAGVRVLYGTMSAAYLTAETWLGALAALVALLLPPQYKTFGLAIWSSIQVLVYSAGPEIIGLALRSVSAGSQGYRKGTQLALAVIIPVGYWIAGIGFLSCIPLLKRDLRQDFVRGPLCRSRRNGIALFFALLIAVVLALFITDIFYDAT